MDGVGLTDSGREQATRIATRMAGVAVARVVSSPLRRCRETVVLAAPGREAVVDEGLGECHYGSWTGRRLADLSTDPLWRIVQDDPASARFPDDDRYRAESLSDMAARVLAAVQAHDREVEAVHGPGAVWLAFSHGDPIKAIVADAVGAGLAGLQRVRVDPGSVTALQLTATRALLLASNTVDGPLAPLLAIPPGHAPGDSTVGGSTGRGAVTPL
jgi:probable phosphomutase (TIGR03848 family)